MTLGRLFVMTLVSFPLLFEFGAGVAMMGVLCVRVSVLLFTDTMKFQQPTTMSITIVFLTSYGFTGFTLLTKLGGQEKKKKGIEMINCLLGVSTSSLLSVSGCIMMIGDLLP